MTKTKSRGVSATKMAVATVALLAATGASFIFAPGTPGAPVNELMPIADGFYRSWVSNNGSANRFTRVNESPCDATSTYVSTVNVGNRVSFLISTSTIPLNATITSITINPCAAKSGQSSGPTVMNVFYRSGSRDSLDGGNYVLANHFQNFPGYTFNTFITETNTTTIEIGAVFTSGSTPSKVELSRLSAIVNYEVARPNAPSNLRATLTGAHDVSLLWSDNSHDETSFYVQKDGVQLNKLPPNSVNSVDHNATPGSHTYSVYADRDGDHSYSVSASIVVPQPNACNATTTLQRVGPDQYVFHVSDPDGIQTYTALSSANRLVYGASGSCSPLLTSPTTSIPATDFPLTSAVVDCQRPFPTSCTSTISYP